MGERMLAFAEESLEPENDKWSLEMKNDLKIRIVEDGQYYMYGNALKDAFQNKGFQNVKLFSWSNFMNGNNNVYKRVQNKLAFGPEIWNINKCLVQECASYRPDLVFLYRCRIIHPATVKRIKMQGAIVFSYNNDNPFATYFRPYFWRHYRNSIKYDDATFVYRESNIRECLQKGAHQVELLRSYYISDRNYPIKDNDKKNAKYDVVFLGHFENDDRASYISALTSAGISVGIPNITWEGFDQQNSHLTRLNNTHKDYNKIINESKIALVFLSSLNKDTYTRRCFEIPAAKTFMLSQYTEDLASMFEPDKEAVYFKTPDELVEKAKYYLEHEEEREKIAKAGYDRLMRDGHEVGDRVQQIMEKYNEVVGEKF